MSRAMLTLLTMLTMLISFGASCAGGAPPAPPEDTASDASRSQTRVWIDTDPSVRPGGHEVDDGIALVQAFHSPELDILGVSAVFGNAELATAFPIAQEIVAQFGPDGLVVQSGADGAARLGEETDATRAMAAALSESSLTILALGPVTNVATLLLTHPDLRARIEAIVAVAGRRPGHSFRVGPEGDPLRDLNFELDSEGFQVLLDSEVPIVLAPFEISSKVWLTAAHVQELESGGAAAQWLAPPLKDWLDLWTRTFDAEGFNPFDALAVAFVTSPEWLTCEELPARIEMHQDDVNPGREKAYLHVSSDIPSGPIVRYCHDVAAPFVGDLMTRLVQ